MRQPEFMQMEPVEKSEAVKAIGYDPETLALCVEFHSGASHQFANVSADVHKNFVESGSKGRHFQQFIRGQFESRKVT